MVSQVSRAYAPLFLAKEAIVKTIIVIGLERYEIDTPSARAIIVSPKSINVAIDQRGVCVWRWRMPWRHMEASKVGFVSFGGGFGDWR